MATHGEYGGTWGSRASNAAPLLELSDVSVHYGAVVALDHVSVRVHPGEVVALMGPNGAGKSTILKAVMGMAPVSSGRINWRNEVLDSPTHEIVKRGISLVPQGRRVFTHLNVQENLELGGMHAGDPAERNRRLEAVMDFFPILRDKRRDPASAMSGGQQQMLALGRGLMSSPDMLLLDEPTLGLAPIIVSEVFDRVTQISAAFGTTIILVEHNIKGALNIVDRAYILDKARVAFEGTPDEIDGSDILTQVFLGRAVDEESEVD